LKESDRDKYFEIIRSHPSIGKYIIVMIYIYNSSGIW